MSDSGEKARDLESLEACARIADIGVSNVALPREGQVILGSMRFHYVDWGGEEKPAILFLHGGNQTARTWDMVCLQLREDYRCLAIDQRGHGDSEWSYEGRYGGEDHRGDVEAFADHMGLEKFLLVGMSMGCLNAMHYAAANSDRLAGLVAVDAGPWVSAGGGKDIIDFVSGNNAHPEFEDFVAAAVSFNSRRDPELLRASLRHTLRQTVTGAWEWKADRRFPFDPEKMQAMIAGLEALPAKITCPTLVVRGGESNILSDENAARFADALPDGRWVSVPGAGHTVQGDQPATLVKEMRAFLSEIGY